MLFNLKESNIIVTGGLGFIGTNLIIKLKKAGFKNIFCLDKYSYSSSLSYSKNINNVFDSNKIFKIDIGIRKDVKKVIDLLKPNIIFHLAAETHVDRSIQSPYQFIESNIIGTYNILEESKIYWEKLNDKNKENFKFIHVSTDEVYGDLGKNETANEATAYNPSSPYSASKASSDHLVKAWNKTYGFPALITNCSNNYGPWQFPDKLIPLTITKIINQEKIPIYGDGTNIRNWIFVEDHIDALIKCAKEGLLGESYCIGTESDISNNDLVKNICNLMQELIPSRLPYIDLLEYVPDRRGHDYRYSIKSDKIKELKWKSNYSIQSGLKTTINWYIKNTEWLETIKQRTNYYG